MVFGTSQNWPLTRLTPWYNGPYGIAGADAPLGIRTEGRPVVIYVDDTHPRCNDNNWGTDPLWPKETIQSAVDSIFLVEGSLIVVAAEASITESVIVPPTVATNCTIMGVGANRHQPTWAAATAAGTALTLRQQEWTIEGLTFEVGTAGTAIRLSEVPGPPLVAIAYKTMIRNCQFDGLFGGLYGIDFYGAPHRVTIEGCEFIEFHSNEVAFAICVTDSAHTNPNQCHILNNMFWQNDNHIGSVDNLRSFNASEFRGNTFMAGADAGITTAFKLDLRGGSVGLNIVSQNVFCGLYSHAGGYWENAAAPGMWVGNIAQDVASGQVADNGFTVAVPV